MNRQHFESVNAWANAAATVIAEALSADITVHGKTSLAVPGGRTASAILPILATTDIDWSYVTITLADERWVGPTHADSNERLAREILGDRVTIVGLYTGAATPEQGLGEATQRIDALRPLGCVLLGMGEDGHVASLFPGANVQSGTLQTAMRDDHPRISLTPTALLDARAIVLAVNGGEKCAVIERALEPGSTSDLPVRHVLHQKQTPVYVLTA